MLRTVTDRLNTIPQITRPTKPCHKDPPYNFQHYAVHLACCWLYELTDAPIDHWHERFKHHCLTDTKMRPATLNDCATQLLLHLKEHEDAFAPAVYASFYWHISQGLTP